MTSAGDPVAPGATIAAPGRLRWLDAAKGLAIALVVLGHCLGGMMAFRGDLSAPWFEPLFFAIYLFHMPLFFGLSGFLVPMRLRRDPGRFATSLLRKVLYPYVLWSAIQSVVIFAAGSLVNAPKDVAALNPLLLFVMPPSQFWFLYVLFVLHGIAWLTAGRVRLEQLLLGSLVLYGLTAAVPLPKVVEELMTFAPFYCLGLLAGRQADRGEIGFPSGTTVSLLVVAALVSLATTTMQFAPPPTKHDNTPLTAMAAVLGSLAVIALAHRLHGKAAGWACYLGVNAMPVYVLHVMAVAGTRIVLTHATRLRDPNLVLPLLFLVGILAPLLAMQVLRRLRLAEPLGLE